MQLCQRIADGQLLRADGFALTAAHTVQGLFAVREAGGPLGFDGVLLAEHAQLVPDAEIVRDVHPHGAGHTVPAAGAANLDAAVQLVGYAFHSGILGGGKRFKMAKGGKVVGQLSLSTHAGEDHMHIFVAAHPAQRPRGIGGIRTQGVQRCGGVCRQGCQRAALDRLHDDKRHAARLGQLIAPVAADLLGTVVPVQIIVLQLAEIPRLVAQNILKSGRVVMAGKPKVPDASCGLLLPQPVHKAHGFCLFVPGLVQGVLGFFLKPLRRFFPAVVTGTVVLSIGLSLISVGVSSFGGGSSAADYGSLENLFIGLVVLIIILGVKHFAKGMASSSSILIGIIAGYVLCFIMGMILPTTAVNADGVEYTKAWVLNFDKVREASWFALPKVMPVKPIFDMRAIVPVLIMFIVTAVETIGDISGVMEGGLGREATDKELSGGVVCDGLGSSLAALFGVLPNTSFSQNVGLVTMTKVVNRMALACGAGVLILCGLFPKLAALISIMPQSVLGGAAVMMFSSIVVSGIQLITKEKLTGRNITIVSVALGLGYGLGANSDILRMLPDTMQLIFGGSGIVPAAIVALVLNIVLPKDEA